MGRFIRHLPCESCGSKDANSLYEDRSTYCFSCNLTVKESEEEETLEEIQEEPMAKVHGVQRKVTPLAKNFPPLDDRGIDAKSAEKYQVRAVLQDEIKNVRHVYPYFDKSGNHIGNKCRTRFEKGFFVEGDLKKCLLFGQQAFPEGGKSLSVTEGELDALAVYQMFGHKYPAVSVKSSSEALKNIQDNYEYVNSFDEIVLCFDQDEPGQKAALEVAKILPLGKVRILKFEHGKDANEYLQKGLQKEFVKEWWSAPGYSPVGIKQANDMWEEVRRIPDYNSIPYPWDGLNELTYGLRQSELVVITADTGVGKSSILRETIYNILKSSDTKVGLIFLEETNRDTLLGLMSLEVNKPLHLPDIRQGVSDEELKVIFESLYKDERVIVWDHFGSNAVSEVLDYVRYMAALGCRYIFLDHLSIVVSDQNGDERKQLDEISTKLKMATMELGICVIAVIHQNRQGQIRGTAGVEQLANIVIKLHREKEDDDPFRRNVTKCVVQKNRFCGRTGPGCWLQYVPESGRLVELSEEQVKAFESNEVKKDEW